MRTPSAPERKRTWWCLNDSDFACYLDGVIPGRRRLRVERHLASCDRCRNELSLLLHSERSPAPSPPPEWIARVRQVLQNEKGIATPRWQWGIAGTALACCLAIGSWFAFRPHARPVTVAKTGVPVISAPAMAQGDVATEVRNLSTTTMEPLVIAPVTGTTVARNLEIKWQPVPAAISYEIAILNADGDTVWRANTSAQSLRLPSTAPLNNDTEYFVTISANLASGKTVRAKAVPFRVAAK